MLLCNDWMRTKTFWQISLGFNGGTFVDWSINYLMGIKKHVVVGNRTIDYFDIPDSPIDNMQFAHKHITNHPQNPGKILWGSVCCQQTAPNDFHTFYYARPMALTRSREMYQPNINKVYQDFIANIFSDDIIPHLLFVPEANCEWAYLLRYLRFKHNIKQYRDFEQAVDLSVGNLSQPAWESREVRAIAMAETKRKIDIGFTEQICLQQRLPNSITVSFGDIQDNLDKVLAELSSRYPVMVFDTERMAAWRDIYHEWRIPNASLKWFNQLPGLVDDIVAGKSDLVYDCDEIQELMIESALMLRGYSIKSYGLLRFPKNLSLLELEPLIHNIN